MQNQKWNHKFKRILSVILLLFSSATSIGAEPWLSQTDQISPYTFKIGAGAGVAKYQYGNSGSSDSFRGIFEYNPRFWGFEIGVNQSGYHVPPDRASEFIVATITQQALAPYNPERFGLYLYSAAQVDQIPFSQTYLDLGPTFHFRPGQKFDPYVGAGLGIGGATLRAYGKVGVRLNFEKSFLFLELEGASINRRFQGEQYVYAENSGLFGAGYYFGASSQAGKPIEPTPQPSIPKEETPKTPVEEKKEEVPVIETPKVEEKKESSPSSTETTNSQ